MALLWSEIVNDSPHELIALSEWVSGFSSLGGWPVYIVVRRKFANEKEHTKEVEIASRRWRISRQNN